MYEKLTREAQQKALARWRDPIPIPIGAVAPYRIPKKNSPLSRYEFLVGQRRTGIGIGNFQIHHGGVTKVTDSTVQAGAEGELTEETGYEVWGKSNAVGVIGPALYRSTMKKIGCSMEILIGSQPANPLHPFIINLFTADLTEKKPTRPKDDEVEVVGWMTLEEILKRWEGSESFNYPEVLYLTVCHLIETNPPAQFFAQSRYGVSIDKIPK